MPTAARRTAGGSESAAGGKTRLFGDNGIPSFPTAVVNTNFPGASSEVNDVAVTLPVTCDVSVNVAVAASCAAIVSSVTVWSESRTAPLMLLGERLTLTRFAGESDVFVTVTSRL